MLPLWLPLATLGTPTAPGGACLSAVSLTPIMAAGDAQVFEAHYGHCEGASAFRIVQLWVGGPVDPAAMRVNLGYEAGRMFIEGGGDCAPLDPVVLDSTWGSLDCALSTVALAGDEMVVHWALRFDTTTFAGVHGVYFDAKGGTGDPEPRLGWTEMGSYEVVAAAADTGTDASSSADAGTSTGEDGDAGSTTASVVDTDADATGSATSDDGSFPGGPPNRGDGAGGCACAAESPRDAVGGWFAPLVVAVRRRRARNRSAAA